uniref:Uncharacterized protein n=1 Tax=viral metagenome TaxID=1070528 RepID=A0A6C0BZY4_9ZZZZ
MRRERSLDLREKLLWRLETAAAVQLGLATPAPQARLRQLLSTVHEARVTLVHEAYTSQVCSRSPLRMEGSMLAV